MISAVPTLNLSFPNTMTNSSEIAPNMLGDVQAPAGPLSVVMSCRFCSTAKSIPGWGWTLPRLTIYDSMVFVKKMATTRPMVVMIGNESF
jgi:hypothetical protein